MSISKSAAESNGPPRIDSVELIDDMVAFTYDDTQILQRAERLDGPWTDVPDAGSPYSIDPAARIEFFRLVSRP